MPRTSLLLCLPKKSHPRGFHIKRGWLRPQTGPSRRAPKRAAPWLARRWLVLPFIRVGKWDLLICLACCPESWSHYLEEVCESCSSWLLLVLGEGRGRRLPPPHPSPLQEAPGGLTLQALILLSLIMYSLTRYQVCSHLMRNKRNYKSLRMISILWLCSKPFWILLSRPNFLSGQMLLAVYQLQEHHFSLWGYL